MRARLLAWVAICSAGCASTQMNDARAMRGIERAENSVGAPHNPTSTADTAAPSARANATRRHVRNAAGHITDEEFERARTQMIEALRPRRPETATSEPPETAPEPPSDA